MINIFKNVFLLIFFILIITPLSFIFKIIGFDPLKIKKGNKISYREESKQRKIDLTKTFYNMMIFEKN